jgi:hypothetical protein
MSRSAGDHALQDARHRADGFGLVHHVACAATMGRAYGDDF